MFARKQLFCKLKLWLVCRGLQMCSFVRGLLIILFFFFVFLQQIFHCCTVFSSLVHNEKQYAYVAGFQGTIVSKLHKCFFLAQCLSLPQKPAIIAYCMLAVLSFVNNFVINVKYLTLINLICFYHTIQFNYFIVFYCIITTIQFF